jgi:hypothetical protein
MLQACVRRRAAISVAANPACPDIPTAERVVNEVWDSCFNDTRPFDEVWEHRFLTCATVLIVILLDLLE